MNIKDALIVIACIAILLLLSFIGWQFVVPSSVLAPSPDGDMPVACTMDARECPDGSFVGRTGPNCEFQTCPNGDQPAEPSPVEPEPTEPMSGSVTCTDEMRKAEACIEIYAPVCAQVQVECITTPCNPVPQTYSNSCFACSEDRVLSYTEGACAGDEVSL